MTTTYTSGRARVHATGPIESMRRAIAEYEGYRSRPDADPGLASELEETARDLREEIEMRAAAGRAGC